MKVVKKKTSDFDPTVTGKESKFKGEPHPMGELMFRYATGKEKFLAVIAIIASISFGAANPTSMLIIGELIDSMGQSTSADSGGFNMLGGQTLLMVYVAIVMFTVATVTQIAFQVFAEKI